ncbi:hypothetical protein PIB30_011604 [Stylosanthes scabra]|uniref:Uncharacterized protein n=1 Tax=Stylosanthes scabra TaxID=79078 RepID=A0ABU6V937_9FABA|nr:hypothetical protein [Stylosanthes scabra]
MAVATWIHASLLILSLLVVGSSSSASYARRNLVEPINSNVTESRRKSNPPLLTFRNEINDLSTPVFMFFNLESQRTPLLPNVVVERWGDGQRQTGLIYWTFLCVIFYQYDPAVDGGHGFVHWSARQDGLYKSYDYRNWVLTKTWRQDNCD